MSVTGASGSLHPVDATLTFSTAGPTFAYGVLGVGLNGRVGIWWSGGESLQNELDDPRQIAIKYQMPRNTKRHQIPLSKNVTQESNQESKSQAGNQKAKKVRDGADLRLLSPGCTSAGAFGVEADFGGDFVRLSNPSLICEISSSVGSGSNSGSETPNLMS